MEFYTNTIVVNEKPPAISKWFTIKGRVETNYLRTVF